MAFTFAFFGSSLVSAYWNGAATYYRGLLRALHERGHRITFYEPDAYDRQHHRDIADPEWARVVVYPSQGTEGAARALRSAAGAQVIVKTSGVGANDAFLDRGVLDLKTPQNRVLYWDVDAPATLEQLRETPNDPLAGLVPEFDFVFTYGGGSRVVEGYLERGARQCVPIYNALDPSTHFPVAPEPRFAADLSFLGNRLPDRERRVEAFFLEAARLRPRKRFLLGGSGWPDKPVPENVTRLGHVYTRDHNAMNASATAVLNVNRDSMARFGFSPPTRVFEAAGAGACIITDAWAGIESFLSPGEEILVARNGEEVAAHLDRLGPERAKTIGRAAQRSVLARHTYAHRALQVEAALRQASFPAGAKVP